MKTKNFIGDVQNEMVNTTVEGILNNSNNVGRIFPRKEIRSKRLHVLIQPSMFDALRREAEMKGLSMNHIVNVALKEYRERENKARGRV